MEVFPAVGGQERDFHGSQAGGRTVLNPPAIFPTGKRGSIESRLPALKDFARSVSILRECAICVDELFQNTFV
jgi:hypothetical protein